MKWFKLILLGNLAFIITAVWTLPLHFATPYIEKLVPKLTLANPEGTVWKGSANPVSYQKTNWGTLSWQVKPLKSLMSLGLSNDIHLKSEQLEATGLLTLKPNQTIQLDNTRFEMDASLLNQTVNAATLDGEIFGNIDSAQLQQKAVPLVNGVINWKQAVIKSVITVPTNDYQARLTPDGKRLVIDLRTEDGPTTIKGNILLNEDWKYQADLNLKSNDQKLTNIIRMAGKVQQDGSIQVKQNGDLTPFIR